MFWSAGWPLLRAKGFFYNLDTLYGGLGIGKLQFLIKKKKLWIRIRKKLIRIHNPDFYPPGSGSTDLIESESNRDSDPKHGFQFCILSTLCNTKRNKYLKEISCKSHNRCEALRFRERMNKSSQLILMDVSTVHRSIRILSYLAKRSRQLPTAISMVSPNIRYFCSA